MPGTTGIRGDIFGGFTAAIVALPLALAFGVASGAGALAGLYGAILVGFFASVFGGTASQISGPTGPMTVVMALVVAHFSGNPAMGFAVVVLAGALQIGFGIAGLGRYIKLVPQPVVSGFMSGIGAIIIILQLAPLMGATAPEGGILVKLAALKNIVPNADVGSLALGLGSFAIMIAMPVRWQKLLPPALVAVVLGSIAGYLLFHTVPVIGAIPSALPDFQLQKIELADISSVIRFALVLAFLGSIDSLLTSLVADSMTRTYHNSNKELIGQGIGNMAAGAFGGIPGAGATMRTLVNIRAGGRTRISGVLHSLVLLAVMLQFSGLASHIPLSVLAGILLKVGIDIIDWRSLRRVFAAPRSGVVIMLTTLLITVFVDLMAAVAVGTVMASLLFVSRMADAQMHSATFHFGAEQVPDLTAEEAEILEAADGRIVLFHVEGPLSFGSARDIGKMLCSSVEKDVLAIDLRDVPFIDTSASNALEEVIRALRADGDHVILFGVRDRVKETLRKTGVLALLSEEWVVATRIEALRKAQATLVQI